MNFSLTQKDFMIKMAVEHHKKGCLKILKKHLLGAAKLASRSVSDPEKSVYRNQIK